MKITEILTGRPDRPLTDMESAFYDLLEQNNIDFVRVDNEPVKRMEEVPEIAAKLDAPIAKQVVVTDRKKDLVCMITMQADKMFNTKRFAQFNNYPRMSFVPGEMLTELLKVEPGTASISTLINDPEHRVQLLIDEDVLKHEYFATCTTENTTHYKIRTKDLILKLLPAMGRRLKTVKL